MKSFSFGHLGDSGLASEIRNPDYKALSRLTERTFYRADLRSESFSRIGVVLMPWDGRCGVVWERREDIDSGLIWIVPLSNDSWSAEVLGEAGILRKSLTEDSWYPDSAGSPGGPFSLLSTRLRYFTQFSDIGLSLMLSGGVNFRPGCLTALSYSYSSGPRRIRLRGVYSSEYFRNGDGEKLQSPTGVGFDWRYRPSTGFQSALNYDAGMGNGFTDEGGAALGWRFGEAQISIETDWNYIFSHPLPGGDISPCNSVKGQFTWDRKFLHLGIIGNLSPEEGWYVKLESSFPAEGRSLMESYVKIHSSGDVLLWDLRVKYRWNDKKKNKLIISIFFGDLGRDWEHGPKSSGDFEAEIRWVQNFNTGK